jgi:hypothetical protein
LGVDAQFLTQLAPINGRVVLAPMLFDAGKALGMIPNWVRSTDVYRLGIGDYVIVCVQGVCDPNAPSITGQPRSLAVFEGASAASLVSATGTAPRQFQWRRNSAIIEGATRTNLAIPESLRADAGTYDVMVTSRYGVTNARRRP